MDLLKRFIDCYIPVDTCNLNCHYCYIAQKNGFANKLASLDHSAKEISRALSKNRLGGKCLINICGGGETMLCHNIVDILDELLKEGHYLMVVTNGTVDKKFEELQFIPDNLRKHLFFKFSLHYLELKRLNWLEKFSSNVKRVKELNCSYTIEVTPNDELIPFIEELKEYCIREFGALCHVTIARDDTEYRIGHLSELDFETYKKTWGVFSSELFKYKSEIYYKKRKEFCYAGEYTLVCDLSTGDMKQCYCGKVIDNIYSNRPLRFRAIGHGCGYSHCYNGHVFLPLGAIPELKTPSYDKLRNRMTNDGIEWITPEMLSFMRQRADINNSCYGFLKKISTDICNMDLIIKAIIKCIIKKKELKN